MQLERGRVSSTRLSIEVKKRKIDDPYLPKKVNARSLFRNSRADRFTRKSLKRKFNEEDEKHRRALENLQRNSFLPSFLPITDRLER